MGRIHGPIRSPNNIHTSPIGVIPKKNRPGKWRLICDLSAPENHCVNDGIDPDLCSMKYISVHDAIREIQKLGKGTFLAKIDIKEAYRIVPVHPQDRPLLGFQWHSQIFVDGVLPFGLRSAPKIFDSLASMLNWILIDQCQITIIHYLDDFLIISPPESPRCMDAIQKTLQTWAQLGVPIAPDKVEGPTTCLTFLGIEIDTIQWEYRLPIQKLHRIQSLTLQWRIKKACRVKELQSLHGYLQDAAKVVPTGRPFIRRITDLLRLPAAASPRAFIRLNAGFSSDIEWWCQFLPGWNGKSLLPPAPTTPHATITSDASGNGIQ